MSPNQAFSLDLNIGGIVGLVSGIGFTFLLGAHRVDSLKVEVMKTPYPLSTRSFPAPSFYLTTCFLLQEPGGVWLDQDLPRCEQVSSPHHLLPPRQGTSSSPGLQGRGNRSPEPRPCDGAGSGHRRTPHPGPRPGTMMFRDQVGILAGWFKGWNECEQTVALLSLLKRVTRTQARFLQLCLEHSLADCNDIHLLESEANSAGKSPPPEMGIGGRRTIGRDVR